jgi:acetylornithine deacetylase/succinyl-diaminopimelate desuccinylase-like protein
MTSRGLIVLLFGVTLPVHAQTARTPSANDQRARDIFEQLININTTGSTGSTTAASGAMADWLIKAGFPAADVQVIGLAGSTNHNLVARFRGTGGSRKPVLLLAHLDVVEARREDWSLDPFKFTEQDGFFYGRGTLDVKDGAAILVATLARLKQEGYRPNRDLILALTGGEEGGSDYNGVEWLLQNHRELIDAEYVINMDGGDPVKVQGKRLMRSVQAAEKVYVTFKLEVHNPGGHSSLPTKENAIYRLALALARVSAYEFPARLNEITRTFFQRMAPIQQGQVGTDMAAVAASADSGAMRRLSDLSPLWNAQLRTTCVATQLAGGHAENALPQAASATVNCRMLPGTPQDEVQRALAAAVNDTAVAITVVSAATPSPPSPLRPEIMEPIERVTKRMWNIPVIPVMETGATDGLFFRNAGIPVYGVSGVFVDINDIRAHGKDERIGVQDYYDGAEYIYQLVREFTSARR